MAAATSIVHPRRFRMHPVLPSLYVVKDCLWRINHHLVRIDHFATQHLQVAGGIFVWLQQVVEALLVNLKIVHHELEGGALFLDSIIHELEDVADGSRNDTVLTLDLFGNLAALLDDFDDGFGSEHGVGLAGATHAVGKYGSVKSGREQLDSFLASVVIHFFLGGFYENVIEGVL